MTAVSRFDMGLVIATGLTIGAFTSLYVAPVIYTYVATAKKKTVKPTSDQISSDPCDWSSAWWRVVMFGRA